MTSYMTHDGIPDFDLDNLEVQQKHMRDSMIGIGNRITVLTSKLVLRARLGAHEERALNTARMYVQDAVRSINNAIDALDGELP